MKRYLVFAITLLSIFWAIKSSGACASSYLVRHNSSTGRILSTDTNAAGFDTNTASNPFSAYFWQYSLGDTVNGGTCTGTQNQVRLQGVSPNRFVFYNAGADWRNTCVNGCPGNPPTGTRSTVVIWQSVGEGTTSHHLLWVAYSVLYNTTLGRFDLSTITNGTQVAQGVLPNNTVPVAWDYYRSGFNLWTVRLGWSPPGGGGTSGNMGYYDTLPTGLPVIQDYEIYYQVTSGSAPTSGALANWTLAAVVPSTISSISLYNFLILPSEKIYFAMRPRFYYGSTFSPPWVGGNSEIIDPNASGDIFSLVSAGVTASGVSVTFSTNSEAGVVSYQVFYAPEEKGPYQAASGIVSATGSSNTYSVATKIPIGRSDTGFIKIKANMIDGTTEWSDPVRMAR